MVVLISGAAATGIAPDKRPDQAPLHVPDTGKLFLEQIYAR